MGDNGGGENSALLPNLYRKHIITILEEETVIWFDYVTKNHTHEYQIMFLFVALWQRLSSIKVELELPPLRHELGREIYFYL